MAELQRLWSDLDDYDPLELAHVECIVSAKQWIECRHVIQLLKGLNPSFEGRRANLFHQPKLPSIGEVIAAMAQEEMRLKLGKGGEPVSNPAFFMTERQETRDCYNCGKPGHLRYDCTAPRWAEEEVTAGNSTVEVEVEVATTTQCHRGRMLLFLKMVNKVQPPMKRTRGEVRRMPPLEALHIPPTQMKVTLKRHL